MNTGMMWQTTTTASEATEQLAERLGHNLRGGEIIELQSDLGGGKTTFTRGVVRGVGSTDRVASPTFTITRTYKAPACTVYHFDFYRLSEAGIVADELAEVVQDESAVTIVEWGDIVHDVLPAKRLTVHIGLLADGGRMLTFAYPEALAYLLEGVRS